MSGITAISANGFHTLALDSDGEVLAWGLNGVGQLGNGTSATGSFGTVPGQVPALSNVVEVAAGYSFSIAKTADGKGWAWGSNMNNQLGLLQNNLIITGPQPVINIGNTLAAPQVQPQNPTVPGTNHPPEGPGVSGGGGGTGPSTPVNKFNLAAATETRNSVAAGRSLTTVTVDEVKALGSLSSASNVNVAVIPVAETAEVLVTQFTYGFADALAKKNIAIEFETTNSSYFIPLKYLDFRKLAELSGGLPEKTKINVIMARPDQASLTRVSEAISQTGAVQAGSAVEFKVEGLVDEKTLELNDFSGYITKKIRVPKLADSSRAVGLVLDGNGGVVPVPTIFTAENGKSVASIMSRSNSIYAIAEFTRTFGDVEHHWAKNDINLLAARMIVSGSGNGTYSPEGKVTRAKFATLVVRALGLKFRPDKVAFADVKETDWYAGAVGAAVEAGIITGYSDGTFRPNAYVTRQEVAAINVKALLFAGFEVEIGEGDISGTLTGFVDSPQNSPWAHNAVAVSAKSGIIRGDNQGRFNPDRNATRAESAVIIKKILTRAGLI